MNLIRGVDLVCPFCSSADDVTRISLPDGSWQYQCSYVRKHPKGEPYIWIFAGDDVEIDEGTTGLASELGLYNDLPRCIHAGEPWVEYGVIEHRYSQLQPETFEELVQRYGHTRQGPKRYTASAFIGSALGWLAARGELESFVGPATGYWAYNPGINYWAVPPSPEAHLRLSYLDYATALGLDPKV